MAPSFAFAFSSALFALVDVLSNFSLSASSNGFELVMVILFPSLFTFIPLPALNVSALLKVTLPSSPSVSDKPSPALITVLPPFGAFLSVVNSVLKPFKVSITAFNCEPLIPSVDVFEMRPAARLVNVRSFPSAPIETVPVGAMPAKLYCVPAMV